MLLVNHNSFQRSGVFFKHLLDLLGDFLHFAGNTVIAVFLQDLITFTQSPVIGIPKCFQAEFIHHRIISAFIRPIEILGQLCNCPCPAVKFAVAFGIFFRKQRITDLSGYIQIIPLHFRHKELGILLLSFFLRHTIFLLQSDCCPLKGLSFIIPSNLENGCRK